MTNGLIPAGWREKINAFLRKPAYIMLLMLLTAVCFALKAELVAYGVIAVLVLYISLYSPDFLPIIPVLICAYVIPSTENNPGRSENSVFSGVTGLIVVACGAVILAALVWRIIRDRKRLFRKNGMLTKGLLILTFAYMLSGIGFPGYLSVAWKNIPYGLIQGIALLLPYWLLVGGVDWDDSPKDYLGWVGFGMGCLLMTEVITIYLTQNVIVDGVIDRTRIYMGWGMYNNLGNLLAMMIPFAFWLGLYYKKHAVGYLVGFVFLAGVFMTCSRSSMIFGTLCYSACCVVVPEKKHRVRNILVFAALAAVCLLLIYIFFDKLHGIFIQILDNLHEVNTRFIGYREGWKQFLKNPVFGGSFYTEVDIYSFANTDITSFMPPRWHNTVIQLLASTGLVGLLAYGYHRYQTLRLMFQRRNRLQVLMSISIFVMLLGSLTDCHMFNVGPGLFYGMILAWMEKKLD